MSEILRCLSWNASSITLTQLFSVNFIDPTKSANRISNSHLRSVTPFAQLLQCRSSGGQKPSTADFHNIHDFNHVNLLDHILTTSSLKPSLQEFYEQLWWYLNTRLYLPNFQCPDWKARSMKDIAFLKAGWNKIRTKVSETDWSVIGCETDYQV